MLQSTGPNLSLLLEVKKMTSVLENRIKGSGRNVLA